MATLDGMHLLDPAGQPTSGAAFVLDTLSKVDLSSTDNDGWNVEVKALGKYVVAWNQKTPLSQEDCWEFAFKAVQRALDLFSISRSADLGVRDSQTEHMVWWPDPAGQVLRLTNVVTISLGVGSIQVRVTDAAGNVVPPAPRPPATWHESLRYFRLAQVTDDLFDAYRNLYLALESILDRIEPQKVLASGKAEPEGAWFKRALSIANSHVSLAPFAPKGSTNSVDDLFDELYVRTRTALFHAKSSRPSFLPHAPGKEHEAVRAAALNLASLFMALAENELGTRSVTSAIFAAGFDMLTSDLKTKCRLQVTDDKAAGDPDANTLNLGGGIVVDLATRHAPELEKPFVRAFLGTAGINDFGKLGRLAVVAATVDGCPIAGGVVEGELLLDGFDRLECHLSIRQHNAKLPKVHFAT
jgi:hypothetical protein